MGGLRNGDHHTPRGLEARRRDGTGRSSGRAGLCAAEVLPHRHGRHRRHLLSDRRPDRQRHLHRQDQRQRRRHQRLGRQRQRHRRRLDGVGLQPGGRELLGLHRHRHLRGQAQGRRAARHRQPLSGKRAHRHQEGARRQDGGRPQGQARLARRAGLGHARQRARPCSPPTASPRRTSSPSISSSSSARRSSRTAPRRLFPDHRLSAGHADRARRHQRLRAAGDRRPRGRQVAGASSRSSPRTRSPPASTRTSRA